MTSSPTCGEVPSGSEAEGEVMAAIFAITPPSSLLRYASQTAPMLGEEISLNCSRNL